MKRKTSGSTRRRAHTKPAIHRTTRISKSGSFGSVARPASSRNGQGQHIRKFREQFDRTLDELKTSKTALARLQDEMATVLDNIHIPVVILGRDLKIRHANKPARQILGHNDDGVAEGAALTSLAGSVPGLRRNAQHVINSLQIIERDVQDAGHRWWRMRIQPVRTRNDVIEGAILMFVDIQKEKDIETHLGLEQRKGQQALDSLQEIVMVFSADEKIRFMNKAGCSLLGVKPEEVTGRSWLDMSVHEEDRPLLRSAMARLSDDHPTQSCETRLLSGGGQRVIAWQISALEGKGEEVVSLLCAGQDISALRDSERKVGVLEERLNIMMKMQRNDEFIVMDASGTIVSWMGAGDQQQERKSEQMIGKHISMFYPPDDFVAGKPMRVLQTVEERGHFEEEGWRVTEDGVLRRANCIFTAIRDRSGSLRGFSTVTRYLDEPALTK
jgi:PAS domain S-box-containing protein